jgi:glycosyltransferase involved in cell wall biosynthesis
VLSSQRAYRELTPGIYHKGLRFTDRLVDGTVVNSAALREHLIKTDSIAPDNLLLCYNSVDLEHYTPHGARAEVLKNSWPVIGSTAVLRPEKGAGTLIEAFAPIARRYPSVGLLLVGGGPMQSQLEARAVELGIAEQCHFAGPVSDVAPWLRRMDMFVLPSLSEALSNSLLEAMAVGCAVVASDVGGNPELVRDGDTGRLFRAGDAADLAGVLQDLVEDSGASATLRDRGRSFVTQMFSREASLGRLASLYVSKLQSKGGGH